MIRVPRQRQQKLYLQRWVKTVLGFIDQDERGSLECCSPERDGKVIDSRPKIGPAEALAINRIHEIIEFGSMVDLKSIEAK
jgi:hypothetical protein